MVGYNDLYDMLRKERYSEQLQILSKNFIKQVAGYFKEKKEVSAKEDDLFSDIAIKNKKKLENAISIFKELLVRRKKKILGLAFVAFETGISKKDFENLLDFEKELFESIVNDLKRADKSLGDVMAGEKKERKYCLVRFLEDVEEFVDLEGNVIGGFKKGEIANLGAEIVDILSKDKRVEIIEED